MANLTSPGPSNLARWFGTFNDVAHASSGVVGKSSEAIHDSRWGFLVLCRTSTLRPLLVSTTHVVGEISPELANHDARAAHNSLEMKKLRTRAQIGPVVAEITGQTA